MCKSDQWFLLTRAHAEAVLARDAGCLWRAFRTIVASDEWYFPTCLAMLGAIDLEPLAVVEAARVRAAQRRDLYGAAAGPVVPLPAPAILPPGPGV